MNIEKLQTSERHESIRGYFAHYLHDHMVENPDIYVVTGGLGYGMFDKIKRDFPERFIDVGAAEMVMMGTGVGLAIEGKIPFCYSITPFLLFRAAETIRNYVNREKIPVKLIGSGFELDYAHDGFSHHNFDDKLLFECGDLHQTPLFPNIKAYWPETKEEIKGLVEEIINNGKPS